MLHGGVQLQVEADSLNCSVLGPDVTSSDPEWDLFVIWHWAAMQLVTSPRAAMRNLAHGGPVFLPWHRLYLLRLEQQLQRHSSDADAGLPYWD